MKLKNIFLTSTISIASIATPLAVVSCSAELPSGDISGDIQTNVLNSEAAKTMVYDEWLTSTYTSLYVSQNFSNISSDSDKTKLINTLTYYLNHMEMPNDQNAADKYYALTQQQQDDFINKIKDAYKYYICFKSSIASSSDSSTTPSNYFITNATTWKKNKYMPLNPIKDENGKELTIDNFNPKQNYTGLNSNGSLIMNDYKILMLTRGTKIFQDVMKMLLSEMYFLYATEDQVLNATNFRKMTKNPASINSINAMAYVEENGQAKDFSTYLLKKQLVENNMTFKWAYTGDDYTNQLLLPGGGTVVTNQNQFNSIKITKEQTVPQELMINSTDLSDTNQDIISSLQAFTGLQIGSLTSSSGDSGSSSTREGESVSDDLSNSVDVIKLFGNTVAGLYDKNSGMMFTFAEINAINKAIENNKTTSNNQLSIPSININKDTQNNSSASDISIDDLNVMWSGSQAQLDKDTQTFTKQGDANQQKITINSISFEPIATEKQKVSISFTYQFTINGTNYNFDYRFTIENWNSEDSSVLNIFKNDYTFGGNNFGIKLFSNDGTTLGISYYLRVLPLFKKSADILIDGKWYMTGKFTFEGTKWNDPEQLKRIVYFLELSDSSIFSSVQDFYLFNNYYYDGAVSEVSNILSSLGLSKKTDDDRKNAGII